MNINDRTKKQEKFNPFEKLQECTDGFVVIGYLKGSHEKFAHFFSSDKACNDALCFFHGPVQAWMDMSPKDEEEDSSL